MMISTIMLVFLVVQRLFFTTLVIDPGLDPPWPILRKNFCWRTCVGWNYHPNTSPSAYPCLPGSFVLWLLALSKIPFQLLKCWFKWKRDCIFLHIGMSNTPFSFSLSVILRLHVILLSTLCPFKWSTWLAKVDFRFVDPRASTPCTASTPLCTSQTKERRRSNIHSALQTISWARLLQHSL